MRTFAALLIGIALATAVSNAHAGTQRVDERVWKKTGGVPTSMPGIYVARSQMLFHNASHHYRVKRFEYAPAELGYSLDRDFFGKFSTWERLSYFGYGLTDGLAVEMEATLVSDAVLVASPQDPVSQRRAQESGLGDVETRLTWQWLSEREKRPGVFTYGEVAYFLQQNKRIIGTSDREGKLGSGVMKSTPLGTVALRAAAVYESEGSAFEFDEIGIDYLKQVTPACRFVAGVERLADEWEFVVVAQFNNFSPARFPENP